MDLVVMELKQLDETAVTSDPLKVQSIIVYSPGRVVFGTYCAANSH